VRSNGSDNLSGYTAQLIGLGDGTSDLQLISNNTVLATMNIPTVSVGDVLRVEAFGTMITLKYNGVVKFTVTNASFSSGKPGSTVQWDHVRSDTTISLFTAGSITASPYSVPDCRNYGNFPNSSRDVQDTLIYDVQTSSNSAVPGTDSRAAGAPVDDRVAAIIPLNSRTPGTFGPGE